MSDDSAQQQQSPASDDALAQLEALLAKAKDNRRQPSDPVALPDPETEAKVAAAAVQAENEAMQAQVEQSEVERLLALEQQQAAMADLENTPQYHARVAQEEKVEEEKAVESAAHDGHEIVQITETKL